VATAGTPTSTTPTAAPKPSGQRHHRIRVAMRTQPGAADCGGGPRPGRAGQREAGRAEQHHGDRDREPVPARASGQPGGGRRAEDENTSG